MSSKDHKTDAGFLYTTFPVGPLQCNCSIVWDEVSKEAILVDPGADYPKIEAALKTRGLILKSVVHTHAHFDHIGASRKVHEQLKAPLHLHPEDKALWDNILMQGKVFGFDLESTIPWQKDLVDEDSLTFGNFKMNVLHTPGHTPGSCSFSCSNIVFAGDTLFKNSVGRTDLWGGDFGRIQKSIQERLYTLDDDTEVITGHGPSTKIGVEQRSNPFVKGVR